MNKTAFKCICLFLAIGFLFSSTFRNVFRYMSWIMHVSVIEPLTPDSNVSKDPQYINIVGKTFELQQDLFIYKYREPGQYYYSLGVGMNSLPETIEEYLSDANKWDSRASQVKIAGFVKKGTKLRVIKIKGKAYDSKIISQLDHPEWEKLRLDCDDLFDGLDVRQPDSDYLKFSES